MKLTVLILAITCSQVSAKAYSQITIHEKNISLSEALSQIQQQSGYSFFYKHNIVEGQYISVYLDKATLKQALDKVLAGKNMSYKIMKSSVAIVSGENKSTAAFNDSIQIQIDKDTIHGQVTDEKGNPLPAVSVVIPGTPYGTMTDMKGLYILNNVPDNADVVFSYVGYIVQRIHINGREQINIVLKEKLNNLDEAVIIGYGKTTKRLNTGSVSTVTSTDISNQIVDNPIQALAGRIPGMTIVQNNGLPGSNQTVHIRGNNTLGANSNVASLSGSLPLYIVDGVPFTNFNGAIPFNDNINSFGITGANGGLSPFSVINPQDIERIDVLKDADATAIYGSRGANGVILITTKKGKSGAAKININVYSGEAVVGHKIDMLNTEQYLTLRKEAFANDSVTPTIANAPDLLTWSQTDYTDYQKLLIGGTAHNTNAQVDYSVGTDRIKFFASGMYRHESTVYPGNMGSTTLSGRMNVQTNSLNNRFTTSFSVNYANDNTNLISTDLASSIFLPPNMPLHNPDGSLYWSTSFTNPLAYLLKTTKSTNGTFIANGDLKFNLFKGFNLKANLGYTKTNLDQRSANPISSQNPTGALLNSAKFANTVNTNYIIEPQAEYTRDIGKNSFTALVGTTFQQNITDATTTSGSGYTFDFMLNTINGAATVTSTNSYELYKYDAVFGRINYNYDKKYIVDVTFRRDGSSRFGPNNRFANFAAIGGAYVFSDEEFIKDNLSFLSFGKLRISYGTTGNDQLPNYSYLQTFSNGSSATAYQGITSLRSTSLANPDLKWETTKKFEIGADLNFFKDRLAFTVDAYWHHSGDLLNYLTIPLFTGYNSENTNLDADALNRGLEFQVTSTNFSKGSFTWKTSFNIAFQVSKLVSFADQVNSYYGSVFAIGYPVNLTRLYAYGGVDPATGAAIIKDLDGVAGITTADRYIASVGTPFFGGLDNTLQYKGFSLNFFLQFDHHRGTTDQVTGTRPGSLNNQNVSVLNRWKKPGDANTLFPGASANASKAPIYSSYTYYGQSDAFYGDASWLKLRSASLSYTLPSHWIKPIGISNLKVYLEGQNLATWAKNKYVLDPETGNALPPLRTIVLGLNLTF